MRRFDAVVVGLGVYGSAVSYELALRGLRVLGVERSQERIVSGASAGPIRMVRAGAGSDGAGADPARAAAAWWRAFAAARGGDLFRPARELSSARAVAPAPQTCSPPWTGLLDAAACVRELRRRAHQAGAVLWFGRGAEVEPTACRRGSGARVIAGDRWVGADLVVSAVGASLSQGPGWLVPHGLAIQRAFTQVATWPEPPAAVQPGVFHILDDGGDSFCVVPAGSGARLQFGHLGSPPGTGAATDESAGRLARERDHEALRRLFPALGPPARVRSIRGAYVYHPAGDFVLTWARPRIAVVTACAGIGFKFAPLLAPQVADIVIRGAAASGQTEVLGVRS